MTAADADFSQCAENVTGGRDRPGRPRGGIAESPQVHPHDVPLPGERRRIGSHILRSATPAWISTTGNSPRGPSRS